jgi:hypothetical protein
MSRVFDPNKEELYTIKEDIAGPGAHPDQMVSGVQSTMNFTRTALGHPKIRYKDVIMEADVYKAGDLLTVFCYCPRCRHNLSIRSDNKQIAYDPETNVLSIEPFQCPWEITEDLLPGQIRKFGFSLCRLRIAIDNNLAKDA